MAVATTFAFPVLIAVVEPSASAAPATVGVIAPPSSRLADDLRRELEASRFVVVSIQATGSDWRSDVRRLPGTEILHGVVVHADDHLMTVFTRAAATADVRAPFEQKVESDDRLARRRACLGVVEYLRVLIENDATPSIDLATSSALRPSPSPSAVPTAAATVRQGKQSAPAESPPAAVGPTGPPAKQEVSVEATATGSSPSLAPPDPDRLWELGVGTTLGLNAAPGGPTAHLQFLWYLPLDWRLAVCVRGLWPVLGGQFRTAGNDVRAWTFGAAVSMQYLFELGPTRWQPFVGASLGARVALTETSPIEGIQSRKTFTPSGYLGADVGVRYTVRPLVKLFIEMGLARGWLIPGVHRLDYEEDAANADSFHASLGALFEI